MSLTSLTVPGMYETPSRYNITVRVATTDGQQPDPAAFAITASQAAAGKNATVVTAHTAREIICVVSVAAPDRASAVAVAPAVVAAAVTAEGQVGAPSQLAAGARRGAAARRTPSAGAGRGSCCR